MAYDESISLNMFIGFPENLFLYFRIEPNLYGKAHIYSSLKEKRELRSCCLKDAESAL